MVSHENVILPVGCSTAPFSGISNLKQGRLVKVGMSVEVAMRPGVLVGASVNVNAIGIMSFGSIGAVGNSGKTVPIPSRNKTKTSTPNTLIIPAKRNFVEEGRILLVGVLTSVA